METVETVKIAAPHVPGGHIVINKSDLTGEPADAPRRGRPRKS